MTADTARARRIPAREILSESDLAAVRVRSPWRGLAMVAHAWLVILGAMALAIVWPNPLTILVAIVLIGSRQLGLAILMHEGAHGLLSPDERTNLGVSQWLCAYPVFAETRAYRRYHLQHHAHTQTRDDPDLVLSAPFPITSASYRRKFLRDITGQTAYEQRKAQLLSALGDPAWPWRRRLSHLRGALGPQILTNVLLAAGLASAGAWWAYPVLWLLPLATWFMVVTRIRNIAEHAVVPDAADPLRNTRTTRAGLWERALIAPYFVNYHLEHHLLFYVPAYNLPRVHRLLMAGPLGGRAEVERGYRAVLRRATSRPADEDRPGAVVSHARRRREDASGSADSVRGGF